jgi:hypothetical protein
MEKALNQMAAQSEREVLSAYKASLERIRSKLALLYEKYSKDGKLTLADVTRYNRLDILEDEIGK